MADEKKPKDTPTNADKSVEDRRVDQDRLLRKLAERKKIKMVKK